MNKSYLLTFILFVNIFFSCSNDNENSNNSSIFSTPLTAGSYWTYNIEDQSGINRDSLFVDSETTIHIKFSKLKMMQLQDFIQIL